MTSRPTRIRLGVTSLACVASLGIVATGSALAAPPPGPPLPPTSGGAAAFPAATIAIAAPAASAVIAAESVAVQGRVTSPIPVRTLVVNGTAATLAADGSFTASVPLALGTNTITVTATDALGRNVSASVTVARTSPPPTTPPPTVPAPAACKVPQLHGRTLAGARSALQRGHCKLGAVRRVRSSRAAKGRVVAQGVAASRTRPAGTKVKVTLGAGR